MTIISKPIQISGIGFEVEVAAAATVAGDGVIDLIKTATKNKTPKPPTNNAVSSMSRERSGFRV